MSQKRNLTIDYFKNLIAIAAADGSLDEYEKKFLAEKAIEFGLPTNEVNDIINKAEELEFTIPDDVLSKDELLTDIVFMSMIDGELHEKEYELCLNIAEKLSLKKNDVDYIIKLIKKNKK